MKRLLLIVAAALALGSCVNADDVKFTGLKSVRLQENNPPRGDVSPLSSPIVCMTVGVENRSSGKLQLLSSDMTVYLNGRRILSAKLAEPVVVAKRFSGEVPLTLRLRVNDPLSLLTLMGGRGLASDGLTVSGEMVARAGWKGKKIKFENRPLSQIMATFGVDVNQIPLR